MHWYQSACILILKILRSVYVLLAPSTFPLMLYRLLKKVYQSLRTFLCSSARSYQSGLQSSGFSEDCASALEASLPANTNHRTRISFAAVVVDVNQYNTFI